MSRRRRPVRTVRPGGIREGAHLNAHPIANLFPMMSDAELNDLADDIGRNGQIVPIVIYSDQIVDGRNRWRACEIASVTPWTTEYDGLAGDIPAFIVSANLKRRHLDESQRAMIAAKIANLPHGGDRSKSSNDDLNREQAAKLMNVGTASVDRAKSVINYGDDALIEEVERGEKSVSAAAAEVRRRRHSSEPKQYRGSFKDSQVMLEALRTMNESLDAIRDMRPDSARVSEVLEAAKELVAKGKAIIAALEGK